MINRIPCEVVQDLLPLYVDKLTKPQTNEEIENHLSECIECSNIYNNMSAPMGQNAEGTSVKSDIDYLKKIKKSNFKRIILGIGITIVMAILLCFLKFFIVGFQTESYIADIDIKDNNITVTGTFYDSASVYSHYKIVDTEEGKKLIVYSSLPSFFNHNGSFQIDLKLDLVTYEVNGDKILPDGRIISKKAQELYASKNPYIGNMSANGKIANILGIYMELGNYTNALQTSEVPYSWTLNFIEEISKSNESKFNTTMKSYAYVLLGLVDNCSEIIWTYSMDGTEYVKSVTVDDAENEFGKNIKDFGENEITVQEMLHLLGIK